MVYIMLEHAKKADKMAKINLGVYESKIGNM